MITILLIWILEFSKLGWHGRFRKNHILYSIHYSCFAALLWQVGLEWYWAITVPYLTVGASYVALWNTTEEHQSSWWAKPLWVRKGKDPWVGHNHHDLTIDTWFKIADGKATCMDCKQEWDVPKPKPYSDRWHVLSALSSWPVEICALWKLTPMTLTDLAHTVTMTSSLSLLGYVAAAVSVPLILWGDVVYRMAKWRAIKKKEVWALPNGDYWNPSTAFLERIANAKDGEFFPVAGVGWPWWWNLSMRPKNWSKSQWL